MSPTDSAPAPESTPLVRIERHGRIAIVHFDRQDGRNALSMRALRELTAAARSFEHDPDVSAVILTGTDQLFSLGADLRDPELQSSRTGRLSERRIASQTGGKMCRAWEEVEPLTIVAIEGWCVGGGAALAVSCDLRVASSTATLYVPEIERGMNLSWGAVPRITRLVGPARAKRVILLAERAASLPPVQARMIKQSINANAHALDRAISHSDFDQFMLATGSGDYAEGVKSFFEKRPPNYSGA